VAGYLSYEAGYPFVDLDVPETRPPPVGWFGVYDSPQRLAPPDVDLGFSALEPDVTIDHPRLSVSRSAYTKAIDQVRHHIGEGDVYQINYTAPVHFRVEGDPRGLYRRLRRQQHVPYGAYLNLGGRQILSCSPELFFRRTGRRVVTRPMKGTIRRGRTLEEDQALRDELTSDPKNRAENLMIVDLLRNDLSRCCVPGSVQVPALYTAESYDTVTQMTSTVEGRLRPDQGTADVLRALFPCGSVIGAPKRRAMQIIRSLERAPRGVYCGAIGMVGPDDTAVFNVAIRTVVLEEGHGTMGVGSGIVWDSVPASEYEECALKTRFLTPSMQSKQQRAADDELRLIETMRFDGLQVPMLDRHVKRLSRSASYFDYPFDEARFRRRVERAVSGSVGDDASKVRATLDRWGRLSVESTAIASERDEPWALIVAEERADSSDPLFFHKTTHRGVYDRALQSARAQGFDEALLMNEEGEVTEGSHSSIFARMGDTLLTPPVECGLLPGVYRAYVLETEDRAEERVLTLDDLRAADALYCCNAVRGWHRAVLREEPVPAQ
jgi:para-aminobenzoate synthetase/4-amino-4-deoxychorismate lyase